MVAVASADRHAVEIEIGGKNGEQLFFAPVGRALRGSVDFGTIANKSARDLRDVWPEPIPGKIVGVNTGTGQRYIREPMHERRYAATAMLATKKGLLLDSEREDFDGESETTWLYWMRRAVDAGLARLVTGELPPLSSFDGERKPRVDDGKPRKNFVLAEPGETSGDRLTSAIEKLAEATAANTAIMAKVLDKLK